MKPPLPLSSLRVAAEAQLTRSPPPVNRPVEELLHELQVHQIELEMQNEELRRAYVKLDTERARYFDLYEMAPVGYLTVSEKGLLLQANLTASTLLGVTRGTLLGQAFSRYVLAEDADQFYLLRKKILASQEPQACELRMLKPPGPPVWFQLAISAARDEFGAQVLRIALSDISERKQAESDLRVAAAAFECQEGFAVLDEHFTILRANQAVTRITGYTPQEAKGKTRTLLRSDRHPPEFYEDFWRDDSCADGQLFEVWMRRKNGEDFLAQVAKTVVRDTRGQVTHYVLNFTDITLIHQQEERRLHNEAVHRNALVREVHHRIKNNLQGITGLLSQFAKTHPATAEPITQAISQVQGISVIHGLQAHNNTSSVRVCELTQAIAADAEILWQTKVEVVIDKAWQARQLAEKEAVPIALILNELLLNALKHGGKAQGHVSISLRDCDTPDEVSICITNAGQLASQASQTDARHSGLKLISALMPPEGACISQHQDGQQVITWLKLSPPVISFATPGPA
jgi:PAS domain S-box-containing protein